MLNSQFKDINAQESCVRLEKHLIAKTALKEMSMLIALLEEKR
jgi:hypothetical protein